jgi:hypothetical protein
LSWYLDSSAILKFIFEEKERAALLKLLISSSFTSTISRIEVKQTVNRVLPSSLNLAEKELSKIELVPIAQPILSMAENFSAAVSLRTLDAIQIASVLHLGKAVAGLISYDKQMITNAKALGINVIHPGMK